MFLCLLPAGVFRSQINYVKLNLAIFPTSLHLVTTGGVLGVCHIEGQKSGLQQFL